MKTEQWRKIDGFPFYEVSDTGIVRSLDKMIAAPHGAQGSYIKKGRIIKRRLNKSGYERVGMMLGHNKVKWVSVHRLVAKAFIPNPLNKRCVNHKDGNKQNNTATNLEWNTHLENVHHAIKNGLKGQARGTQFVNRTSFDDLQVKVIKSLKGELTQSNIGQYFGVHRITISDILNGRTWKHVCWQS